MAVVMMMMMMMMMAGTDLPPIIKMVFCPDGGEGSSYVEMPFVSLPVRLRHLPRQLHGGGAGHYRLTRQRPRSAALHGGAPAHWLGIKFAAPLGPKRRHSKRSLEAIKYPLWHEEEGLP